MSSDIKNSELSCNFLEPPKTGNILEFYYRMMIQVLRLIMFFEKLLRNSTKNFVVDISELMYLKVGTIFQPYSDFQFVNLLNILNSKMRM